MHKKSAKQSFLQGAVIMMAASLVVKVIGAFFQIPLQNLIGGDKSPAFGMFSAAYRIYTAMLVISTVGLPAALSKMVAEATAKGREHEVKRIVRVAAGVFVPVGALCSLALLSGPLEHGADGGLTGHRGGGQAVHRPRPRLLGGGTRL